MSTILEDEIQRLRSLSHLGRAPDDIAGVFRSPRRRMGRIALAFSLVLATGACDKTPPAEEGKPTGTTCPSVQTLTYANFGQAFMQSYCLRCHSVAVSGAARLGAPEDHNFDAVEDVRPLAEHIDELAGSGPAATNTEMPEDDPKPSTEERRKLSEWLACGAP